MSARSKATLLTAGAALVVIGGCSSSSSGGHHATPSTSPAPTTHSGPKVTVDTSSLLQESTLAGTNEFMGTGTGIKDTAQGLQLTVPPNQTAYSLNTDSQGLPSHLEVGVTVTPPDNPGLLYGLGCDSGSLGFGQYVAVTDSQGRWEIVEYINHKVNRTIASGTATLSTGDTQINLACVEVSNTNSTTTTRISFALADKIVKTIDDTSKETETSNGYNFIAADPSTGKGGTVMFHDLKVYPAQAVN